MTASGYQRANAVFCRLATYRRVPSLRTHPPQAEAIGAPVAAVARLTALEDTLTYSLGGNRRVASFEIDTSNRDSLRRRMPFSILMVTQDDLQRRPCRSATARTDYRHRGHVGGQTPSHVTINVNDVNETSPVFADDAPISTGPSAEDTTIGVRYTDSTAAHTRATDARPRHVDLLSWAVPMRHSFARSTT